ncbi:hypothetical protein [Nonomuraea helvata]|uniref:ABC transporter ATP-binding protein n=1 Tax=Nonomuraea helvata TaxID=37484 RepID=A0ABV5SBZ0_9ACTN
MRTLLVERIRLLQLSLQDRKAVAGLVLVHAGGALAPAAAALSTGWLVAALTGSASGREPATAIVWPLVAMAALLAVTEVLEALGGALEQFVAGRVDALATRSRTGAWRG